MSVDFGKDALPGAALHTALRKLREEQGPVARVPFGGRPAWIVTGHEALTRAFKDEAAFPAGEWCRRVIEPTQGRTFESMDGPEHHRVRRLATPAFRSHAIARMKTRGLAEIAHELNDGIAAAGRGDLVPLFTARFPFLVISRTLGVPSERERDFVGWALGILAFDRRATQGSTLRGSRALAAAWD